MIDLPYSLVIEATDEPDFFGFHSPELEGFTGVGHSVEDCLYQARWGMKEHLDVMQEQGLEIPAPLNDPVVTIRNQQVVGACSASRTLSKRNKKTMDAGLRSSQVFQG